MSKLSQTNKCKIMLLSVCVLLFTGVSQVNAAENILGDWVFTIATPDMGMGPMNLKINSTFTKDANNVITGTWQMEGMGPGPGEGMPTLKVVDVKIEDQKLTFIEKMDGGNSGMGNFQSKFTGTIKGDAIDGKIVIENGGEAAGPLEFALKGERKAAGAATATAAKTAPLTGLAGDWEFVTTIADMGLEMKANVTFKKAADGKYSATWVMTSMGTPDAPAGDAGGMPTFTIKIEDINQTGEKLTFVQKTDLSGMGMGELASKFVGTLKGDKIEGTFTSDMGESKSVGTRKKPAAASSAAGSDPLVGNWEFKMKMGDAGMGTPTEFNIKSVITKGADGKYAMTWEQVAAPGAADMGQMGSPVVKNEDIKLDGQNLTFVQKVNMMGTDMAFKFTGTVKGAAIDGKLAGQGGGDMGMPAMELTVTGTKK
jgi:hypothetical protein